MAQIAIIFRCDAAVNLRLSITSFQAYLETRFNVLCYHIPSPAHVPAPVSCYTQQVTAACLLISVFTSVCLAHAARPRPVCAEHARPPRDLQRAGAPRATPPEATSTAEDETRDAWREKSTSPHSNWKPPNCFLSRS